MKATPRKNGQYMVNVQITVSLSLYDMAMYFTADKYYSHRGAAVEAERMSKSEIIERIKYYVSSEGTERADYVIGDNNLEDQLQQVLTIFKNRFKAEFPDGSNWK